MKSIYVFQHIIAILIYMLITYLAFIVFLPVYLIVIIVGFLVWEHYLKKPLLQNRILNATIFGVLQAGLFLLLSMIELIIIGIFGDLTKSSPVWDFAPYILAGFIFICLTTSLSFKEKVIEQ